MEPPRHHLALRESHSFPRHVIDQIHGMAEEGRYEIRGWGAKRALPTFDDLVFVTASASRYPIEGYRETCSTTTVLGSRYASKPLVLDIPITIAGMSFGALSGHAKEALGRAATAVGTSTTTGDGGMTTGGARGVEAPRVPVPAEPLRVQPPRRPSGRCDRDRHRPGSQARRRRHAPRPEGQRAGGGHAHPAGRDRSALGLPPPGLDRARRPGDEDRGAPGGDGLAEADLREDRGHPRGLRREAGRGGRGRRGRRRRPPGRDRGDAGRLHRARRDPDAGRGPPGRRGAAGDRQAPRGPADRVRRHPLGRRRGEGAGARGGRRVHRRRLADRPRLQPPGLVGHRRRTAGSTPPPTTRRWAPRPATATTATPASARSASRRRSRSSRSGSTPRSGRGG